MSAGYSKRSRPNDMAVPSSGFDHVSTLVCRVMGVGVGFDTGQINGMTDVHSVGERDCRLVTMHELFGLDAGGIDGYTRPKVLIVKGGYLPARTGSEEHEAMRDTRIGVVVDEPEEIIEVPVDALRPMPGLAGSGSSAPWAVALMPEEMILMMDIRKTISRRMPDVKWHDGKWNDGK